MGDHSQWAGPELDDLFLRLKEERDSVDAIREEILRRGSALIERVIERSFSKSGFSKKELFRPGYLGLLNAVYNYDLSHGKTFEDYATNLIKGEIRNHIRDQVGRSPVPRWMRDLNRQIEATEALLLRERGRFPTLSELAEAVNITEEGLAEIFKAREAMSYVSLDEQQREHDPVPNLDPSKIRSREPTSFPIEYRIKIASALERLADLQQYLLQGLFRST